MKLCPDIHVDRIASPAGTLTKSWSADKYKVQALNWQQKGNKTQEAGDTTFDMDIRSDQRIDFNDFADPTAHHEAHTWFSNGSTTIRWIATTFLIPSGWNVITLVILRLFIQRHRLVET